MFEPLKSDCIMAMKTAGYFKAFLLGLECFIFVLSSCKNPRNWDTKHNYSLYPKTETIALMVAELTVSAF